MAMMPNSRMLTEMMRMYSVEPVPIARSLRESIRLSDHIHATTSSAEKNQYDTTLSRESSRIETWALPSPNHAICVPKATTISTDEIAQPQAQRVARAPVRAALVGRAVRRHVLRATSIAPGARPTRTGSFQSAASSPSGRDWSPLLPFRARKTTRG